MTYNELVSKYPGINGKRSPKFYAAVAKLNADRNPQTTEEHTAFVNEIDAIVSPVSEFLNGEIQNRLYRLNADMLNREWRAKSDAFMSAYRTQKGS